MTHYFHIVDVFADAPYGGNPLAVVVGPSSLPDETMQKIALETNYSETTFIGPDKEADGGYRVRMFTPSREIDFAGHPLLGTAHVIRHHVEPGATGPVCLNLPVGQIPVTFESTSGGDVAWFLAPPITAGQTCARADIAAALGLTADDIDDTTPVQRMSAGLSAVIVPLRSLSALKRAKLDLDAYGTLAERGFPPLVYMFCRETHHPENDVCARFFFEAHGVREDPATGNGAAFLGAYLLAHGKHDGTDALLRIEQGYEVHRPSLVLLRARETGGTRDIFVGGRVIATVKGELVRDAG